MAERMTEAEIRAAFEGVYAMESWHDGDSVEHAPAADGRWVLMGDVVVSTLIKTAPDKSGQTIALWGHYIIEDGAFSYGYDGGNFFMQKPGGTGDLYPVPFGEIRRYEASRNGDKVLLAMADALSYNRMLPSLSWDPAAAVAEGRRPGALAACRAELAGRTAVELRGDAARLVAELTPTSPPPQ